MSRRLGLALALLLGVLVVSASPASAEDAAVQRLGACLAGGGQGDLMIVIDTSASLRDSDPDDRRVEAVGYLLEQLAGFVEQTDATIDVAVAGFAQDFRVSKDWSPLDADSVAGLVDAVASYEEKDRGWETDYWTALNGARQHLAKKAGDGDCQALVWLSDGMFDLDVRDTGGEREAYGVRKPYGPDVELTTKKAERAVERAGVADLCRAGGVADALRTQGVTTLAIGLQGAQPRGAFDLMKGVATGAGRPCGDRDPSGVFVLAQGIGDLFFAFDELADPDHPPISGSTPLCRGEVCAEGTHRFVVDPSISGVRVLGGSDLTDYYAVLLAPDGTRARLTPGREVDGKLAGATVQATWLSEGVFSLRLDRAKDAGWTGAWRVVFVDPASTGRGTARTNIRLYGDLEPAWPGAKGTDLIAGEKTKIRLGLQREDGSPLDLDVLEGTVSLDATLLRTGERDLVLGKDLDAADLAKPLALDLRQVGAGPAKLDLALTYTTAAAGGARGTTLEPRAVDFPVTIAPPPDYPTPPDSLDFGRGDSAEPVTVTVPLEGKGCAWLASAETLTLPEGVAKAPVSSATDSAGECQEDSLTLALRPAAVGSGLVSGHVTLMTRAADSSAEPVAAQVPFRYEMQRPLDAQVFWLAFVLVLALGLLLPLGLLLVVKWWNARIPGRSLSLLGLSGPVHDHGSFLDLVSADPRQIRNLPLDGAARRSLPINASARLRTRAGLLRLTEPGHVVVEGRPAVTSSGARLPLAVQDTWVALLDAADPHRGPVEVVLLLSEGAGRLDRVLADARTHAPEAVRTLRRKLGSAPSGTTPTAGPPDDWSDGGSAPGGAPAADPHDNW